MKTHEHQRDPSSHTEAAPAPLFTDEGRQALTHLVGVNVVTGLESRHALQQDLTPGYPVNIPPAA